MQFLCPHCSKNLEIDLAFAGQILQCPTCQKVFSVPMIQAPPHVAAAPSWSLLKRWGALVVLSIVLASVSPFWILGRGKGAEVRALTASKDNPVIPPSDEPKAAASTTPAPSIPGGNSLVAEASRTAGIDKLIAARLPDLQSSDIAVKVDATVFIAEQSHAENRAAVLTALLELFQDPRALPAFSENDSRLFKVWRNQIRLLEPSEHERVARVAMLGLREAAPDGFIRTEALTALAGMGPLARPALPIARQQILSGSTNAWLLARSMDLLSLHEGHASLDMAEVLLKSPHNLARLAAARAVASNATVADSDRLLATMHRVYSSDTNWGPRFPAGVSLKTFMSSDAAFALFQKDANTGTGLLKTAALRLMGLFGTQGLSVLRAHVFDPGNEWACLDAIAMIGPPAISLLPEVQRSQNNPHPDVKRLANKARISIMGNDQTQIAGIGAKLKQQANSIVVESVVAGGPAERAGLVSGMTLLRVDGEKVDPKLLDQAVLRIRGPEGSTVALEFSTRDGERRTFRILRKNIQTASSNK